MAVDGGAAGPNALPDVGRGHSGPGALGQLLDLELGERGHDGKRGLPMCRVVLMPSVTHLRCWSSRCLVVRYTATSAAAIGSHELV
ncbi:hypothetical protein [Arthrobacter sp. UYCo732]|uniref:hypothetical protein n=1 Tax=Arthrobacter sp. UYCo732 TaxID=3156336 RepID=UPI00339B7AA9